MTSDINKLTKLITKPSNIDAENNWKLSMDEQLFICHDCHSNLFYISPIKGVVANECDCGIIYNKEKRYFTLTTIGLNIYCAECGSFNEDFTKYFYPEDKLIMTFNELDMVESYEVEHCLSQFNQKHTFTPLYKDSTFNLLLSKLNEYIKKYPLKPKKSKLKT